MNATPYATTDLPTTDLPCPDWCTLPTGHGFCRRAHRLIGAANLRWTPVSADTSYRDLVVWYSPKVLECFTALEFK